MNSTDNLMGSEHIHNTRHSGALGLWIVLVTSVILLAFVFSWMLQTETWTKDSYGFSRPGHHAGHVPVTELKLSAAEAVSRLTVADRSSKSALESMLGPTQSTPNAPSGLSRNLERASEPELNVAHSAQRDSTLSTGIEIDVDGGFDGEQSHFINTTDYQSSADVIVRAGFDASINSPSQKNDSYPKGEVKSVLSSIVETGATDVIDSVGLTADQIRSNALDSLTLKSQGILFAAQSKTIENNMDSVLTDISNILSLHDDTKISVSVSSREYDDTKQNIRLSQERGRAIIYRLVSQGIDFARFSLDVSPTGYSPEVSHIVRISASPLVTIH